MEKKIIKSNILIAKFMGMGVDESNIVIDQHGTKSFASALRYGFSWNALMPVVHKCLTYCHERMLNEWENSFADKFMACNIDALYKEVVEFIEWYNKQN